METTSEWYELLYEKVVTKLGNDKNYIVETEEDFISIKERGGDLVGTIEFGNTVSPTRDRRGSYESVEEKAIHISFIRVEEKYQGQGMSLYLFILALIYCKIHYQDSRKVVLEDCSDNGKEVIRNLYFKIGMTPVELIRFVEPNVNTVPISRKRGSEHILLGCPERVGSIDYMIDRLKSSLGIDVPKRRGGSRKITKRRKERKTKRRCKYRKSRTAK